ncbi:hypothetical protein D9M70_554460 [compost metagenome]
MNCPDILHHRAKDRVTGSSYQLLIGFEQLPHYQQPTGTSGHGPSSDGNRFVRPSRLRELYV